MALPQNNMMSSIMSSTTGNYHTGSSTPGNGSGEKQCLGQILCMSSCKNSYTLGPVGHDGCRSCTCESGSGKKSMVCHFDQILSFQSEINNIFVTSKHSRNGEQINSFVSLTVHLYELAERTILI